MPVASVLQTATSLGETIDGPSSPLSAELLELLGMESGVVVEVLPVDLGRRPEPSETQRQKLPPRPPVVTLMGHVDHGKTSLLDAFRGSKLADAEAGGITQSISAFTVDQGTEKAITFIDTPGHELFAAMRQRGASITDIVLLVVAVDSGVQPTTAQAIQYAHSTNAPIVVAANKIDRDGAQDGVARVAQQLLQYGVAIEDMGGEVPLVGVSAKKRMHLDDLREAVLLQAELMELRAEVDGAAEGIVLEASTQKGLGIVCSVLVRRGKLQKNDHFVVGTSYGKVRNLQSTDAPGELMASALPSTPVRISGLKEMPRTGDTLYVVPSESRAREIAEFRASKQRLTEQALAEGAHNAGLTKDAASKANGPSDPGRRSGKAGDSGDSGDEVAPVIAPAKLVPCLLKADSMGSLEAVRESLSHFPTDRVRLQIVRSDVTSQVTESDVQLAETIGAFIVGFNVGAANKVRQVAEKAEVGLMMHEIVYELQDGVRRLSTDRSCGCQTLAAVQ